ncbi:hypothetical protein LF599_07395 [Pseudodesulfovibrio thermohalotolerans]|uniref:hypothetical protein n=1 Tax=Pseudodesulfovibrio thermohalotolerans TaxID=2880651 RepID=UPI0022B9D64F|nr:hypothetical protein [Pseudodesulfovibrio thermohalotolerans]WFS63979.1 hypothetical protein LF599_07395 [Pseudodesulfovibrio thermohalotolerans]
MNRYLKFSFMSAAFGSAVVAGINAVTGNLVIAMAALAVSMFCAGYPVVKTKGWK